MRKIVLAISSSIVLLAFTTVANAVVIQKDLDLVDETDFSISHSFGSMGTTEDVVVGFTRGAVNPGHLVTAGPTDFDIRFYQFGVTSSGVPWSPDITIELLATPCSPAPPVCATNDSATVANQVIGFSSGGLSFVIPAGVDFVGLRLIFDNRTLGLGGLTGEKEIGPLGLSPFGGYLPDPRVEFRFVQDIADPDLDIISIPEPGTLALFGFSLAGLSIMRKWRLTS